MLVLTVVVLFITMFSNVSSHGYRADNQWVKPPTPKGVVAHDFLYQIDGASYTGYISYPKEKVSSVPGVLVAHQWYGLGPMEQYRAEEMTATLGYVAFALDVYGTGKRATNDEQAEEYMNELLEDPKELHKRVYAGLTQLREFKPTGLYHSLGYVNETALTANGYCFGGLMVLELARTGGNVVGVTSFHGELGNLTSQDNDRFHTRSIQVHHAQDDFQGDQVLRDFENEMTSQNVSHWTTTYYGHMEHGWTDPSSSYYRYLEAESAHASMFGLYQLLIPFPSTN